MDLNNSDSLTRIEVIQALKLSGFNASDSQVDGFIKENDTNLNGRLNFAEFKALV